MNAKITLIVYFLISFSSFSQSYVELIEKYQDDIIAIGESGLDYYWLKKISQEHNISREDFRQIQKDFFF